MEPDRYSFDTSKEQPEENFPTPRHAAVSQAPPPFSLAPTTLSAMNAFSAYEPPQENGTARLRNDFDVALEDFHSQTSEMLQRPDGAFTFSDQSHNNAAVQEFRDSTDSAAFASAGHGETVSGNSIAPPSGMMSRSNTLASNSPCRFCKARETPGGSGYV
ncbi:hypothetical protein BJX68DRAFT_263943 [Aspergillus pseudodeflectus]|uniref:Uncharacterized protein n=1 Tax=Aspergillus pseudodeflectus TaxID=176178 RepID=A0ABR4KTH9_9EURO